MKDFSVIPSINNLLDNNDLKYLISQIGRDKAKELMVNSISNIRKQIKAGTILEKEQVMEMIKSDLQKYKPLELKAVINCTGTILHTNLGRAVLSKKVMDQVSELLTNYVNVEFDLRTGRRGKRGDYINQLLCNLTNAEAGLVVNNNASATFLILNEFSKNTDVLVSRGELVEIGGSFRVPDIMSLSGANLKEVGTTNKTKLSDYQAAIDDNTSMIMKVHQSNFQIVGFTHETAIDQLIELAKKTSLLSYYDLGSGLISRKEDISIKWDHTVREMIDLDIDLVSFSGDKLLGSTQAGIIVGKKKYIDRLKKNPLYRILRVGKLTDAVLYYTLKNYLNFQKDFQEIPFFKILSQGNDSLLNKAKTLSSFLNNKINHKIIKSLARTGGGSMPGERLDSFAIEISETERNITLLYLGLMEAEKPIVSYLQQGKLILDIIAVEESDIEYIAEEINNIFKKL